MLVFTHPKEIESKSSVKLLEKLKAETGEDSFHLDDKTTAEWKEIIKSDANISFVGPVFWWGLGHNMDKWVQEVFSYGFAYEYQNGNPTGLLNGREFSIHLVHGTPADYAVKMRENIKDRLETGIFGFSNAKVVINYYDKVD